MCVCVWVYVRGVCVCRFIAALLWPRLAAWPSLSRVKRHKRVNDLEVAFNALRSARHLFLWLCVCVCMCVCVNCVLSVVCFVRFAATQVLAPKPLPQLSEVPFLSPLSFFLSILRRFLLLLLLFTQATI